VPLRTVTGTLKQICQDDGAEGGQEINVVVDGDDAELDLTILERLGSILVHLARNAVDHGSRMRRPGLRRGSRQRGGKAVGDEGAGRISLTFSDDGKGMTFAPPGGPRGASVCRPGIRRVTERELLDLLFLPGFTTAESQTEYSGRGLD